MFLSALYCLLLTAFLWGCGADGGSAPPGSTITINPTSFTFTDTRPVYNTQNFVISVKDSKGNPINKAAINISYIFAAPNLRSTDGNDCVQFYNGSTPVNSPFSASTDEYGVYNLRVDFYGFDCSHKGNLEASSGSAYATATISVNQEEAAE